LKMGVLGEGARVLGCSLPYAAQSLVDCANVERLGVECTADPFKAFLVFRVLGLTDGFQKTLVAWCSSYVFGGQARAPARHTGYRMGSSGGRAFSTSRTCCQLSPKS